MLRDYQDRLKMALDDLEKSKSYCELMIGKEIEGNSKEGAIREALYKAFVISYGRSFTTSKTVNKDVNSLVGQRFGDFRDKFKKGLPPNLLSLHKKIIDLRDKAVAHSDAVYRNFQHHSDFPITVVENPHVPFESDTIVECIVLIESLIKCIEEEIFKVYREAFGESDT